MTGLLGPLIKVEKVRWLRSEAVLGLGSVTPGGSISVRSGIFYSAIDCITCDALGTFSFVW